MTMVPDRGESKPWAATWTSGICSQRCAQSHQRFGENKIRDHRVVLHTGFSQQIISENHCSLPTLSWALPLPPTLYQDLSPRQELHSWNPTLKGRPEVLIYQMASPNKVRCTAETDALAIVFSPLPTQQVKSCFIWASFTPIVSITDEERFCWRKEAAALALANIHPS